MSMQSQTLICGIRKPLSVLGWEQRGAHQLRIDRQRIFLDQTCLRKRGRLQKYRFRFRAVSSLSAMAQSVLSKPHRFILVSDLDWTMVRISHSGRDHVMHWQILCGFNPFPILIGQDCSPVYIDKVSFHRAGGP